MPSDDQNSGGSGGRDWRELEVSLAQRVDKLIADPRKLRDAALRSLVERMQEPIEEGCDRSVRGAVVGAASRVLSHLEWREDKDGAPERALVEMMGSPERALEWIDRIRPKLVAVVAKQQQAAGVKVLTSGGKHGDER